MFKYWKKIDELNHINRLLLALIGILLIILMSLIMTLMNSPKRVEFWLTPEMSANGGLIKANQVPDEYVHGFVSALLPTLNTWSQGKEDYLKNMHAFHDYFTPRHQQLMAQTRTTYQQTQLFNRSQTASLYRFMEPGDIKRLSQDSWEVHLILRITQRLSEKSPMVIADKVVEYHLRVVKVNLSKLQNPFQLALDGYTEPERLINDLLSGETHEH